VILKYNILDDEQVDMQLIFGFLGLFNILLFWPCFFIFDITGIETFVAPPWKVNKQINKLYIHYVFNYLD
jgi:solute carrier family 35 protein F5